MSRRFLMGVLALLVGLPWGGVGAVAAAPERQAVAGCRYVAETSYAVCDDEGARFRTAYERLGVAQIGYPISRRYRQDGFVTQAFQKGILQWRPDVGRAVLTNVFDDLSRAGYDEPLLRSRQTPKPLPAGWDGNRAFPEVVRARQALLDARPALRQAYFASADPLTFYGLPTSEVADMGNHYAVRLQRAVLQEWKETVPWARAGQVTIANGGDIAKELGAIPTAAQATERGTPPPEPAAPGTPRQPLDPSSYAWLTVDALRARSYGVGEIERLQVMERNAAFTRYLIRYNSDGLNVGGFMNIPAGQGPFPIILVNHGWMPTESYETLTYTTKYADALARAGYLVLHSNYRNHRGSDNGPNDFRVGYAIDVLNLIELAKKLPEGQPNRIGLWGHSMGGGITLRTLTVTDDVKAALVYGSMNWDERENYQRFITRWMERGRQGTMQSFPISPEQDPALFRAVSPVHDIANVNVPVAIHHGELDDSVPFVWSVRLRDALTAAGKSVEFYAYPTQPHNFVGAGYDQLMARTIAFFDRHLKGG